MKKLLLTFSLSVSLLFFTSWCSILYTYVDYHNMALEKIQNWDREGAIQDLKKSWVMCAEDEMCDEETRTKIFDNWMMAIDPSWLYD